MCGNRSGKYWGLNDWKYVLLFRTLQIIVISMKITSPRRKSASIVHDMKPKFEDLNIIFGNKSTGRVWDFRNIVSAIKYETTACDGGQWDIITINKMIRDPTFLHNSLSSCKWLCSWQKLVTFLKLICFPLDIGNFIAIEVGYDVIIFGVSMLIFRLTMNW